MVLKTDEAVLVPFCVEVGEEVNVVVVEGIYYLFSPNADYFCVSPICYNTIPDPTTIGRFDLG